jgi:ribosomal protein S18 acetylase RimI-like enzyme
MSKLENIRLRLVEKKEINALHDISRTTFLNAFADKNDPGNMSAFLSKNLTVESLTAEMENPGSQFYFAETEEALLGYLKLNTGAAQTDSQLDNAMEIERIYLWSHWQGKQIGQWMLSQVLEKARAAYLHWVWLGVWEKNTEAIRFYERNGFVPFGKHAFKLGNDAQTDLLMKFKL